MHTFYFFSFAYICIHNPSRKQQFSWTHQTYLDSTLILAWLHARRWYRECGLGKFGLSERNLLVTYYLAVGCVFEPERYRERLVWAKTAAIMETIKRHFGSSQISGEHKTAFRHDFAHSSSSSLHCLNSNARWKSIATMPNSYFK